MDVDPQALLDLAVDVAQRAGRLLLEGRPERVAVTATKSSPTDVVTAMDTAAERLITDALRAVRPDDGLLGEEGASGEGTSGVRWVIDPIDGTVNYLYGLPAWAVSIAAEVDGEAVAGVVSVPPLGETFTGLRGGGAARNGQPLRLGPPPPLDRALIATGFGYDAGRRAAQARVLAGVLPRVRDIRRGGSAALDLCSVACGRVDGYYERGTQRWDVAAGALIVGEAGGRVGGLHGAALSPDLVVAAPPGLFEPLHDLLAGLDAARD